jgi:hypothetical protein
MVAEYKHLNHVLKGKLEGLEKKVEELKEKENQKENSHYTLLKDVPLVPGESENMRFTWIIEKVLQRTIEWDQTFWMWGWLRIGKMQAKIVFSFHSNVCQEALIKQSSSGYIEGDDGFGRGDAWL